MNKDTNYFIVGRRTMQKACTNMLEPSSNPDSLPEKVLHHPQTFSLYPATKREASVVAGRRRVDQTIHGAPFHSKVLADSKIQSEAARKLQSQLVASPWAIHAEGATMTASVKNTLSAIRVLEKALHEYETRQGPPKNVLCIAFNLKTLLNSVYKCVDSLAAQIRFYQSAKGPTRALVVTHEDGREEFISGQKVHTLCMHLPGSDEDAVVFGKPDALSAIANALAASGHKVTGPAVIDEHAEQLGKFPLKTDTPSTS